MRIIKTTGNECDEIIDIAKTSAELFQAIRKSDTLAEFSEDAFELACKICSIAGLAVFVDDKSEISKK